jgi:acetylornithine deacetylase/succinyl-diaminopimelate desuccinylase-like protein
VAGDLARAASHIYSHESRVLPIAPFAAPAALLLDGAGLISCGLERPSSALFGPNEHLPIRDLVNHARFVTELISRLAV